MTSFVEISSNFRYTDNLLLLYSSCTHNFIHNWFNGRFICFLIFCFIISCQLSTCHNLHQGGYVIAGGYPSVSKITQKIIKVFMEFSGNVDD